MNFAKLLTRSALGSAFVGATMLLQAQAADAAPVQPPSQTAITALNLNSHAYFQLGSVSTGLIGYSELCERLPTFCNNPKSENLTFVILDDGLEQEIFKTNLMVNAAISPRSDDENYGQSEHWQRPDFIEGQGQFGDCEDYVIAKIEELSKIGIPRSAMSIVHVNTSRGEGHAVLAVRTTKGDLVLDNLTHEVLLPHETGHTPVQIEAGGTWKSASLSDDARGPLETMTSRSDPIGDLIRNDAGPRIPVPSPNPFR